jgi:hypothetical protein
MLNHLLIILTTNFLLSTTCLIIHTQRSKDHQEICIKNRFQSISTNDLRVCYLNNNRNRSILVWFIIDNTLYDLFHVYRFILRSIDDISLSTLNIHILTNFTELIDLNNSLRILNLDPGQYEICLDFQSNLTSYIYSPRNSCISIRIGELLHRSFKQSSTQLFIALITGIILFLILGLVVQSIKTKRLGKHQDGKKIKDDHPKQRTRSSSILSTVSLKKQRDRIARKLFRNHIDQLDDSRMRQWARNRAFRHRISTHEQEIQCSRRTNPSDDIYTIPFDESSQKISSFLTLSEEFELL